MKKYIKHIIGIFAVILVYSAAHAQISEFTYQVSFPSGDFKDFNSKTSFVGFTGQYRKRLSNPKLSLGGSLSWFYFQDKQGKQTKTGTEGTATGTFTNFSNIYMLLVVFQYDFKDPKEKLVPFVRVGAGTDYQDQRTDVGLYEVKGDGMQFASNVELGVRLNRDINHGLILAATYHYLPSAGDVISTSFFGVKLGISGWK